jgi:hypothetical protein
MKTNLHTFFIFSSFTIFLLSCDPGVKYDKVIQNDSDFDLLVKVYPDSSSGASTFFKGDSIVINKKTITSIFEYSGFGQTFEYEDCKTYTDSIVTKIMGNEGLNLSIDLNDKLYWTFSILDRTFKEGGTCECRVKITNDMIK